MPATLSEQQLKAALTNEQITAARTKGLAAGDTVNPVAEEIATACARVDAYTAGWLVSPGLLTGWARDLAAWHVAKRLDTPTEAQTKAKERAEKELEDVRDAKFPGLARDPAAAGASGKVASGGRAKVL
jgi:hypothetical protein